MKIGMIINSTDAETVFNAFRFAVFMAKKSDRVRVFLMGSGVKADVIGNETFDTKGQIQALLAAGGRLYGCGSCLKTHGLTASETRPASTMDDLYEIVRESERLFVY